MDTCIAQLPAENAASEVGSGIGRLVRPQATSDIAYVPAADRAGISRWAASFRQLSASSPFRWGSMAPSCRWTSIGSWERRFSRPTATTATATTPASSAGGPSTKVRRLTQLLVQKPEAHILTQRQYDATPSALCPLLLSAGLKKKIL